MHKIKFFKPQEISPELEASICELLNMSYYNSNMSARFIQGIQSECHNQISAVAFDNDKVIGFHTIKPYDMKDLKNLGDRFGNFIVDLINNPTLCSKPKCPIM